MNILISILIWVAGFAISAAAFLSSLILRYAPFPIANREQLIHSQCFWWSDAILALNPFWAIDVKGLENIDHSKTYVVVANHQSLADIVIIYQTHMYFKWVAKEALLKVPFIGGLLWVNNHILVSKGDFGSIKKVYRKAAEWLRAGTSMLFFPEGTRSATDEMGEFQNGAFKLAIMEKKPILPVYIGGTREAIPKNGFIFNTKVRGRLVIFPPIETTDLKISDYASLRDRVRTQLKSAAA